MFSAFDPFFQQKFIGMFDFFLKETAIWSICLVLHFQHCACLKSRWFCWITKSHWHWHRDYAEFLNFVEL